MFPRTSARGTSATVKLAFQSAPEHYLNVYESSGPVSQRQTALKAGHENRVCSRSTLLHINDAHCEIKRERGSHERREKNKKPRTDSLS
ncbi:hypothetical protein QQF64_024142 [Cirrhinus molitorella]|uniref:Uncharacterized protein n=1 Tax=Cirrhinus molitorella TaxID=172907 RepID=A0ABR3NKF1_9TELE